MEVDVDVDVDVVLCCLSWQAALTPDAAMIPHDDIFGETMDTCQDQLFTEDALPEHVPALLLEGIQDVCKQKREMSDAGKEEGGTGTGRTHREKAPSERDSLHI